jgi:hypothetical protein
LLVALAAGAAFGQQVVSAKSGLIHYVLGDVTLDGKSVEVKFGIYPQMKENSVLSTTSEGMAEVLLGPSAILRMDKDSTFKLISDSLSATRLQLQRGSIVVDVMELPEANAITLALSDAVISIEKPGVYRLDAAPPQLRVYDGQASVERDGPGQMVKKGKMLALTGVSSPEKFDTEVGDALFRWAKRRAEYLAMANVSAARYAGRNYQGRTSGWLWNPYYGMFTYLPYNGIYRSFWGCRYYSPGRVHELDRPVYTGGSSGASMPSSWHSAGGGYHSVPQASSGSSGVITSSATAGASNPSAPAPAAAHPAPSGGGAGRAR